MFWPRLTTWTACFVPRHSRCFLDRCRSVKRRQVSICSLRHSAAGRGQTRQPASSPRRQAARQPSSTTDTYIHRLIIICTGAASQTQRIETPKGENEEGWEGNVPLSSPLESLGSVVTRKVLQLVRDRYLEIIIIINSRKFRSMKEYKLLLPEAFL